MKRISKDVLEELYDLGSKVRNVEESGNGDLNGNLSIIYASKWCFCV